ncbi:uncharacterized protein EI90DRAFT_2924578 [Cantharellus anzutake]|uniref:uncharacterized protein n=1 Tax=Cantharellus anzutake TaxID=1750568 RepID=UPI00190461CA|nr:uncharacterized protein EI90DRAFT_2924578 [Cantharellus anzutake]KAF8329105.1 hypothetical protein EI90DRAFT_2924578 [Cantharellus anzutake]
MIWPLDGASSDVVFNTWSHFSLSLNLEAASFTRYITPTKVEQKVRHLVIEWIRNEIVRHIPDAEVLVFGSTPVDMYLPSGDIDLVVQSKSLAVEGPPRSNITRIADILRSTDMALGEVRIFASAKIPILKFVSRHGKFSIDISVNVSNGVAAASIIRDFIRDIPGVKPLSLIVKCFLRSRDANEVYRGGLSSYLVVCMVIYFFQTHKGMRKSHTDPSSSLGNLLLEFLQLFGYDFNYLQSGISLRDGGKTFSRSERHWIYRPSQPRLCIEDPQNTQLDAGAGIHDIRRIQMLFIHAYDQLQAEIQRRDRSRSKALLLEGNSLLQIIMGVPLNVSATGPRWIAIDKANARKSSIGSILPCSIPQGDSIDY